MHRLIEGVSRFRRETYPLHRDRFRELATGQAPDTLFITCSDSRIVPGLLLDSGPGELFIVRNAGNIVPPHGKVPSGESATIEYAIEVLKVPQIVVCGHSDCGAMRGAMYPEKVSSLKAVAAWLRHAPKPETAAVDRGGPRNEKRELRNLIERNVLAQIANLRTYPFVSTKVDRSDLAIYGWVFDIEKASFSAYDPAKQAFVPLSKVSRRGLALREVVNG